MGYFNIPFLITLVSGIIAEIFFFIDYNQYMYIVSISIFSYFISMLYILRDLIDFKLKNFPTHLAFELLLGLFVVVIYIAYIAFIVLPEILHLPVFLISFVGLLVFLAILYGIAVFNKNPSNILLGIVATVVLIETSFALMYTYILSFKFFLLVTVFCACIAKLIFAVFLTRLESVKKIDEDYI